jgi:hypothetical protein
LRSTPDRDYLTGVGTYERYGCDIDDSNDKGRGKGAIMLADEWLAVINAERDREIRQAQRARLVARNRLDDGVAASPSGGVGRAIGRIVGSPAQPGRAVADTAR